MKRCVLRVACRVSCVACAVIIQPSCAYWVVPRVVCAFGVQELKAGLQEEVEACVADFLAKREQELQAIQPAVLKERRKRALSCERDDLLLFFGVFLTAAASKSDDTAMLLPADSIGRISSADGDEDSDDQDGVAEGDGEEDDGWCILDEWRTGRQKRTSANGNAGKVVESLNNAAGASSDSSTDVDVSVSTSGSGTRSRMGSSSSSGVSLGSIEGKSVAAVQTWVKHIPFDFGATKRQSSREENEIAAAAVATTTTASSATSPQPTPFAPPSVSPPTSGAGLDEELAMVEAAISGTPRATATPATIEATTTTTTMTATGLRRGEAAVPLPAGVSDEERERIRAEMARLNGQLAARRKEVEEALRPIVAIVPATTVNARARCSFSHGHGPPRGRSFHFLDLVLYD